MTVINVLLRASFSDNDAARRCLLRRDRKCCRSCCDFGDGSGGAVVVACEIVGDVNAAQTLKAAIPALPLHLHVGVWNNSVLSLFMRVLNSEHPSE